MTNYRSTFLDKIEGMILSLGGNIPDMVDPTNFEARSLQLLDALNNSVGVTPYTRLSPRVQEWDSVQVSTAGQLYTLSSIPQDRNCLAHLLAFPGASSYTIRLYIAPPSSVKPSAQPYTQFLSQSGSLGDVSAYYYGSATPIIVPAENGQIWARLSGIYSDSYQDGQHYTNLWVLGYWAL